MAPKANPARVKTHLVYTVWEVADLCNVHRQTVLRWIKEKGLRADTSQKPWLILGSDLKLFLGQKCTKRIRKLDLHQCYCLGCKAPRAPDGKMADYIQQSPTTGMLTALCPACGNVMNKVIRRADLETIRAKIDVTFQTADPRLVSRDHAPSNVTLGTGAQTHAKAQR